MPQFPATLLAIAALAACSGGAAWAQAAQAPLSRPPAPAASEEPNPQAPPFKSGMVVVDRSGARVGVVQSVTETTGGPNVVISVEGKLIGVSPTTLRLQGQTAISRQSKADILASAGAASP